MCLGVSFSQDSLRHGIKDILDVRADGTGSLFTENSLDFISSRVNDIDRSYNG